MDYLTIRWLFVSHRKELENIKSVTDLKRFVFDHTRRYITNMESYKKGMKMVNWDKVYHEITIL